MGKVYPLVPFRVSDTWMCDLSFTSAQASSFPFGSLGRRADFSLDSSLLSPGFLLYIPPGAQCFLISLSGWDWEFLPILLSPRVAALPCHPSRCRGRRGFLLVRVPTKPEAFQPLAGWWGKVLPLVPFNDDNVMQQEEQNTWSQDTWSQPDAVISCL